MKPTETQPEERLKVLIAEDSPTQAQQLRYILERQGYAVTVAGNGRKALEQARQQKPTLIISDVVMPEMDGYELCRQVKGSSDLSDVPLILVTTLSEPQDVIRGLECRAANFILKPYDEHYLLNRIQFVLLNREMRRAEHASGMGVEIFFNGQRHFITADRLQILNLLLSTYEAAIQRNKELKMAQDDLYQLNVSLESVNKELDAFAHSVSHDLRAPLRAIGGYSEILLEDSEHLSERDRHLLGNVVKGAQDMGKLIDGLLNLSRTSRSPLSKRRMSVETLVKQVMDDLQGDCDGRKLDLRIGTLPDCNGDPTLMRQVFINLLSNALKYTRKREETVVEVGSFRQTGETVYYVRDNGAGFNMEYSGKLFGVFQRLHGTQEFEGTGVGLSIVQRIILRHGGRIWAEAAVDEGATFYFTLPQ